PGPAPIEAEVRTGAVEPSIEPFPPYPRPSHKGGNADPAAAWAYWRSLPPEFIERSCFYVCRDWPVLDRLQELTPEELLEVRQKRKREPYKNIDKRYGPYAEADMKTAFLRYYGSGDYTCYFNDTGVKGS